MGEKTEAQCRGKQRFVSPMEARKIQARSTRYRTLHIYRCRFCGGWHLGNSFGKIPKPA